MTRSFQRILSLLLFALSILLGGTVSAGPIPGLSGGNRSWVVLLVEDHAGMREIVWDPAFADPQFSGAFLKDHRYAIVTSGSPGLVDLGCWDQAWPSGTSWRAGAPVAALSWTSDRAGFLLSSGGGQTWLPLAANYDGKAAPIATFRGAYLNWLLENRGTTPSIPRETRWQRLQRGAEAAVRDLLTRDGGRPEYRIVGLGTSGRLLIPPGEGLQAGLNAVGRMEPADFGPLKALMDQALETVVSLKSEGNCSPGIVLPVGDGFTLNGTCAGALSYEASPALSAMITAARAILATGQAEVWTWSLDGPRAWAKDLADAGQGQRFSGDAVAALDAALKAWMGRADQALQLSLASDQPALTRVANITLTLQANHRLTSATLNGQVIATTGLATLIPITLVEGQNTFTVAATDSCAKDAQATASITLDTTPPRITLTSAPPTLTNRTQLTLSGKVDDPTATLTLNGTPLAMDAAGAFAVLVPLEEGNNGFAFIALDLAGNTGRLDVAIVRDTVAPIVILTAPLEGWMTNAATLTATGTVSDPSAQLIVNGQPVPLIAESGKGTFTLTLAPPEGPFTLIAEATSLAGNVGRAERHVLIDRTAPTITLNPAPPPLIAASTWTLTGTVDDPKAILKIQGTTVELDASGGFTFAVNLAEGANTINLSATDLVGNTGTLPVALVVDTLPPVVHFTEPVEGLFTNARSLVVSGQVDDVKAEVRLEGASMPLDATGFFTQAFELIEGPRTFAATATDVAGHSGNAARAITVDWTPPVITLDGPVPARTANPAFTMGGRVDDPLSTLTVNGNPVTLAPDGRFSLDMVLMEGANGFQFQAVDAAGNMGTLAVALVLDSQAPRIRIDAPVEGLLTSAATLEVKGQVDDPSAQVQVNGQNAGVDASGAFTLAFSPAEGPLTLLAVATDAAGNIGRDEKHLIIDRTAPHITLNPAPPTSLQASSLALQGQVDDPSALLTLNGQTLALTASGAFSTAVNLSLGTNPFTFQATDPAGNVGSLSVSIQRDHPPLTLNVTGPSEGATVIGPSVAVSCTVSEPASVLVNGVPLSGSGTTFTGNVPVGLGTNLLTFQASTPDGRTASATRTVTGVSSLSLQILTPLEGALTNLSTTEVAGTVSDPLAQVTVNGMVAEVAPDGAFMARLKLPEGPQILKALAQRDGQASAAQRALVIDRTPPVITLSSPEEGYLGRPGTVTLGGKVDDPTARLLIAGKSAQPATDGTFSLPLELPEGGHLLVVLATDPAGNTGHASRGLTLDGTPPALAWTNPTPAEGDLWMLEELPLALTVSEKAQVTLNAQPMPLREADLGDPGPWLASLRLRPVEGPLELKAEARDAVGNTATITRKLEVGFGKPRIVIESPAEGFSTALGQITLTGRAEASPFVGPLRFTINEQRVTLDGAGRFSFPAALAEGRNGFRLAAVTRFGAKAAAQLTLFRWTEGVKVQIQWPLDGLAMAQPSTEVRGTLNRPVASVMVNGTAATLGADALSFSALAVPLAEGANTLVAEGLDAAGNKGQAQVQVTRASDQPAAETYQWLEPANGVTVKSQKVNISGSAGRPGVVAVSLNGQALALSGTSADGAFQGEVQLPTRGLNGLLLDVRTLSGKTLTERRDITYLPDLPRLSLAAPEAARRGETIRIELKPDPATPLRTVDLSWNGRLLGQFTPPFAPISALVPVDAVVGSRIPLEALATDLGGETVTVRTHVLVLAGDGSGGTGGPLTIRALDDRSGLPLVQGSVTPEGGAPLPLDDTGRAVLPLLGPNAWILMDVPACSPVWRQASQLGGPQDLLDARPTPLAAAQDAGSAPFQGVFAGGAFELTIPAGILAAPCKVSLTPLSSQGLPALLPAGWSAVAALWASSDGTPWTTTGATLKVLPPTGAPASGLTWARWDSTQKLWTALATPLGMGELTSLPLPGEGGYALLAPDPAPTAPPTAVVAQAIQPFTGELWRDGLQGSLAMDPPVLPTLAALNGVHAFARVDLAFGSLAPLPSGGRVQADLLETYLLLDQRVIEPGMRRQDFQVHRFALSVDAAGKPFLRTAGGLSLDLPVRMSRTFGPTELVEGLIDVGVYNGAELLVSSGEIVGPGGGSITRDGITFVLGAGAAANPVLVRLQADPAGEVDALWPELKDLGRVALSFQIEIVGALQQGYGLTMADLGTVSEGQKPLLVQHKILQGRRRALAVGAFDLKDGAWALRIPAEGNPLLTGGEFAVLIPNVAWDWVTGRCVAPRSLLVSGGSATEDQAVPEVYVLGGLLLAGSGPEGRFALPAVPATTLSLTGRQDDLGIQGTLAVAAPSSGNLLRLTGIPFRLLSLEPAEGEEVGAGLVIQALFSTQADGNGLAGLHLIQTGAAAVATVRPRDLDDDETGKSLQVAQPPGASSFLTGSHRPSPAKKNNQPVRTVRISEKSKKKMANLSASLESSTAFAEVEIPLRRSLSLDGRTLLLTPERGLDPGATFRLELTGLKSTQGEVLAPVTRRFTTHPLAPSGAIALDRITLSYPDADLNVSVTIPEGAIPPWSLVELTAEGFGSTFMGTMPPSGPLGATLRAALGEEIRIAGSTPDHRGFLGILSRYVALDGRTTLGKRGGRIEGPQGLAVVLAPGSLTEPIEFRVELLDAPAELPPDALVDAERMMPGLRLRASKAVDLLLPPRIELPLSRLPGDLNLSLDPNGLGNGPVAVIRREVRTLPDGSEDVVNVLMDTAQVSGDGSVVRGLGGLRYGGELSTAVAMKANKVPGTLGIPVGRVLVSKDGSRSLQLSPPSPPSLFNKKEKSLINRDKGDGGDKRTDPVPAASSVGLDRPLAFNLSGALLDVYLLGSGTVPARHPVYHSGYALRNWNGSRGAASLPEGSQGLVSAGAYNGLPNAEIYRYAGTVGLEEAVRGRLARGRLLSTCDAAGRYVSIGGPSAGLSDPNQTWIALYALDPRTGETSIDPGARHIGEPGFERYQPSYDHWILITSQNDPFDPSLAPPRLKVRLVDGQGQSQNLFPVGDAAQLVVGVEPGSQAVGRGKVSGDLEAEFGSLGSEQRFPVTFVKEGAWRVDVEGWSALRNVRALSTLEAVVLPQSKLGPSLPGPPRIIAWTPEKDDKNVEPSTQVRISFNEPLASVSRADFSLRQDGQDVAFRLVAGGREVTAASGPTQEVLLLPLGRLALGKAVVVSVGSVRDLDGEAFSGETWSFTVREADELGRLGGLGSFRGMVANAGYLYAIEEAGTEATTEGILYPSYAIRILDARDPSAIKKLLSFGGHGLWEDPAQPTQKSPLYANFWAHKPFHNHEVRGLKVARGVGGDATTGKDLLLVWSSPWVATEPYEWTGALVTGWLSRHSTLWVFDITGDPATWPSKVPKLVTSISLGTQSDAHGIGVGQSGSLLGVLRRRNGLSLWDAKALEDGFSSDATALEGVIGVGPGAAAQAPFDTWGKAVLAWRSQTQKGYYPPPTALSGDNALRYEAATGPTVLSAALGTGDDQKAVMAAVMGYGAQKLYLIDSRQGSGEAKVTYIPGGPEGLDGRMQDISEPFGIEKPAVVELSRGQWQGATGSEEGLLLLVATRPNPTDPNATSQHLWVLQVKGDDRTHTVTVLAKGPLNGLPKFIQIDPVKMLVAVRTQTGGAFNEEIFDLKVLQPTGPISAQVPMVLNRIAMIANGLGASALFDGMLAVLDPQDAATLKVVNLFGTGVSMMDLPWEEDGGITRAGTGMRLDQWEVSLLDKNKNTVLARVKLTECPWLLIREGINETPLTPTLSGLPDRIFQRLDIFLKPGTGRPAGSQWVLRIWGSDRAGNGFEGQSNNDAMDGKPMDVSIEQQKQVP